MIRLLSQIVESRKSHGSSATGKTTYGVCLNHFAEDYPEALSAVRW